MPEKSTLYIFVWKKCVNWAFWGIVSEEHSELSSLQCLWRPRNHVYLHLHILSLLPYRHMPSWLLGIAIAHYAFQPSDFNWPLQYGWWSAFVTSCFRSKKIDFETPPKIFRRSCKTFKDVLLRLWSLKKEGTAFHPISSEN